MTGAWGSPAVRLTRRLVTTDAGCIEWTGGKNDDGYGSITVDGKKIGTHRLAWSLSVGPIPDGLQVLHHCDNPPCCNVEHLFLGTPTDNMQDMSAKGRASGQNVAQCPKGHPYDKDNTYLSPKGARHCRACARVRCLASYHKNKILLGTRRGRDVAEIQVKCKWGHPHSPTNTYVSPSGVLICRTCSRESAERYRLSKKALSI